MLEVLELIASREQQLQYQRDVPIAQVSAELFNMWDDIFDAEFLNDEFSAAFSAEEIQTMRLFDGELNKICSRLPRSLPSIEKFILTPQWEQLSQAANKALLNFRKNDL